MVYYNKIYGFDIPWAIHLDEIVGKQDLDPKINKRSFFKVQIELLVDNGSPDAPNVDKFDPYLYGYYGVTEVLGSQLIIRNREQHFSTYLMNYIPDPEEEKINDLPTQEAELRKFVIVFF